MNPHSVSDNQLQRSNRLLEAITQAQAKFIAAADPRPIFNDLLIALLALTDSEYGFIGEILYDTDNSPYLKTYAVTDIAWNEETQAFYNRYAAQGLEFKNLQTLFGAAMISGKPVLANNPATDLRRGGLPEGHPPLNAFLGLPFHSGGKLVGMIGVANRPGGYDEELIAYLKPFLTTCAVMTEACRNEKERQQAEAALRETQERYEMAAQVASFGVWEWDIASGQVYTSTRYRKLLGFDEDNSLSAIEAWRQCLHPDDAERVIKALDDHLRHHVPFEMEYRLRVKTNGYRWFYARGKAAWDEQGKPLRMLGSLMDIHERRQAEEALRESERRFQAFMDNSPAAAWIMDEDGCVKYYNQIYHQMFVETPESAVGKTLFDLFPEALARKYLKRVRKTLAANQVIQAIESSQRADGTKVKLLTFKFPLDIDAEKRLIGGVALDVTQQQQTENQLRLMAAAIASTREGVIITDSQFEAPGPRIVYVNQGICNISGYSEAELLGQTPRIFQGAKTDTTVTQALKKNLENGLPFTGETINYRKGGSEYHASWHTAPIVDATGRVTHYVAVVRDITEKKKLENQLMQAQKMDAIGRLAGGVAHDFNNIITVISGYSQLLLQRYTDDNDPYRSFLSEIKNAADKAASLTRQLLTFSRQQVLQTQLINPNDVIADMKKMLRRLVREDIELQIITDVNVKQVRVPSGQLEQVIMNLVVNACDAMPDGGKIIIETITIYLNPERARLRGQIAPGNYIVLVVSDTGVGMDAETQSHIFDPFFTTKEIGRGTGLGLSTVHNIVSQSGGYIDLYSEPQHGTTFKIYLPQMEDAERSDARTVGVENGQGSETILLVEDEFMIRDLLHRSLRNNGYDVLVAEDGRQALQMMDENRHPIDLLLTDMVMPGGVNGFDLAQMLSKQRPQIKVLYMSGYTDHFITGKRWLTSDFPLLQKPFTPNELVRKVREVLDRN